MPTVRFIPVAPRPNHLFAGAEGLAVIRRAATPLPPVPPRGELLPQHPNANHGRAQASEREEPQGRRTMT